MRRIVARERAAGSPGVGTDARPLVAVLGSGLDDLAGGELRQQAVEDQLRHGAYLSFAGAGWPAGRLTVGRMACAGTSKPWSTRMAIWLCPSPRWMRSCNMINASSTCSGRGGQPGM